MSTSPIVVAWIGLAIMIAALVPLLVFRAWNAVAALRARRLDARMRQVEEGR